MTTTNRQPPQARHAPQGEPERQPIAPASGEGRAKPPPQTALDRLAAPLLALAHVEADLGAQARLLKGIIDEEAHLARMPAGRPREERGSALLDFVQRTVWQLGERQVRVGNALQRYPHKLAHRLMPEAAPRDELTRGAARGAVSSPATRRPLAAPEESRGRSATRGRNGSSAAGERAGRGRSVAGPRVPLPPTSPPSPPSRPLGDAPLLGKSEVFVEMAFAKHRMPDEVNRAFLPMMWDARTGKEVFARASMLLLPDERLVLMASMFDQGSFGKARPALLMTTGEQVMVKEMRRRMPRSAQDTSRLGGPRTQAPKNREHRHGMDRDVQHEYDMLARFGGAGAGLGKLQTSKNNFLVLGAMDDSLLSVQDGTTAAERSALVRHLGPAFLRQVAQMHAQGALHLDLKASNALVTYRSGTVALSDFGSARDLPENGVVFQRRQPSTYPAPEIARQRGPDELLALTPACDVWSAAMGLLEMLQPDAGGSTPFSHETFRGNAWAEWHSRALPDGRKVDEAFLAATASHRFTAYLQGARRVDDTLTDHLLASALHPNPGKRPSAAQLARQLTEPPQGQESSAASAARVFSRKASEKANTLRGQLEAGLAKLHERLVEDYPHLRTRTDPFA